MSIISETKNELTDKRKNDTTETWARVCPKCDAPISYKRYWDWVYGSRKGGNCKRCVAIANSEKCKEIFRGKGNPFYGKKHSDATRRIMSEVDRSWMFGAGNPMKDEETKKYFSVLYTGHGPMSGKHHSEDSRRKLSVANSGKNNPMYGKPSPGGSGNGWANWYAGEHFRSLRELQYYISEVEGHNVVCESAQSKQFRIPYKDWAGVDRTYKPDFFVDNHWLVEVKPQKLWNTKTVVSKKLAAEKFCRRMGYEYKLVDVGLNSSLLKEKYLNGEIRFVEKYKERFEKHAKIK